MTDCVQLVIARDEVRYFHKDIADMQGLSETG